MEETMDDVTMTKVYAIQIDNDFDNTGTALVIKIGDVANLDKNNIQEKVDKENQKLSEIEFSSRNSGMMEPLPNKIVPLPKVFFYDKNKENDMKDRQNIQKETTIENGEIMHIKEVDISCTKGMISDQPLPSLSRELMSSALFDSLRGICFDTDSKLNIILSNSKVEDVINDMKIMEISIKSSSSSFETFITVGERSITTRKTYTNRMDHPGIIFNVTCFPSSKPLLELENETKITAKTINILKEAHSKPKKIISILKKSPSCFTLMLFTMVYLLWFLQLLLLLKVVMPHYYEDTVEIHCESEAYSFNDLLNLTRLDRNFAYVPKSSLGICLPEISIDKIEEMFPKFDENFTLIACYGDVLNLNSSMARSICLNPASIYVVSKPKGIKIDSTCNYIILFGNMSRLNFKQVDSTNCFSMSVDFLTDTGSYNAQSAFLLWNVTRFNFKHVDSATCFPVNDHFLAVLGFFNAQGTLSLGNVTHFIFKHVDSATCFPVNNHFLAILRNFNAQGALLLGNVSCLNFTLVDSANYFPVNADFFAVLGIFDAESTVLLGNMSVLNFILVESANCFLADNYSLSENGFFNDHIALLILHSVTYLIIIIVMIIYGPALKAKHYIKKKKNNICKV